MMMANHLKNFAGDTPIQTILKINFRLVKSQGELPIKTDHLIIHKPKDGQEIGKYKLTLILCNQCAMAVGRASALIQVNRCECISVDKIVGRSWSSVLKG